MQEAFSKQNLTKQEHSAGAVIYHYTQDNQLRFLLVRHLNGHWSFAKGHLESGESPEQAAIREIKEETNLEVNLTTDFHQQSRYKLSSGKTKLVDFFLAESPLPRQLYYQRSELRAAAWLTYAASLDLLSFPRDREILTSAKLYLEAQPGVQTRAPR